MQKTKIIATLGPSCHDIETIKNMLISGLSVFRINGAHLQNPKKTKQIINQIRRVAKKIDRPISIMMDLGGPKIRVKLPEKINKITVNQGSKYSLGSKKHDIPLNTKINVLKIYKDAKIKIDDGKITFKVVALEKDKILIQALNSGIILNNKGVNFPGLHLKLPAVTTKDRQNINLAIDFDVDWLAQSFVRQPTNIYPIKRLLEKHNKRIPIIAKIETAEEAYSGYLKHLQILEKEKEAAEEARLAEIERQRVAEEKEKEEKKKARHSRSRVRARRAPDGEGARVPGTAVDSCIISMATGAAPARASNARGPQADGGALQLARAKMAAAQEGD